jgi:predicted DNA-binding transcriptional regulator AlpA
MAEKMIVTDLAELPSEAIVFKKALATMLGKCTMTVDRMVKRGELPRPIRFTNQDVWTAGVLREHMSQRLDAAAKIQARVREKITELSA